LDAVQTASFDCAWEPAGDSGEPEVLAAVAAGPSQIARSWSLSRFSELRGATAGHSVCNGYTTRGHPRRRHPESGCAQLPSKRMVLRHFVLAQAVHAKLFSTP